MLRSLHIKGFKSLADVQLALPRLTVLFGPNAAGKSNVLDAVQALSRIGTLRTLSDALAEPIIGFLVRDRRGLQLFGDNTFLSSRGKVPALAAGDCIAARFAFRMPVLPLGDYSITVALANGSQDEHVQNHWIHDALIFRSHSSSVTHEFAVDVIVVIPAINWVLATFRARFSEVFSHNRLNLLAQVMTVNQVLLWQPVDEFGPLAHLQS